MLNPEKLIKELTLKEKIQILSGYDAWYTHKIERLNIPSLKMSDGPNGVRGDGKSGKSSACFPCAISVGSTWNMELINELGQELGNEAKAKGVDVLLGPTINIHRHPLGGRHFECFSEDPFLTGKIAIDYVSGVQSREVAACLKHFVGNDTEFERYTVSSNIDEKTLREIYLLPFEMAIKEANAQVVMSAYNKLNNIYIYSTGSKHDYRRPNHFKDLMITIKQNRLNKNYIYNNFFIHLELFFLLLPRIFFFFDRFFNVWIFCVNLIKAQRLHGYVNVLCRIEPSSPKPIQVHA